MFMFHGFLTLFSSDLEDLSYDLHKHSYKIYHKMKSKVAQQAIPTELGFHGQYIRPFCSFEEMDRFGFIASHKHATR